MTKLRGQKYAVLAAVLLPACLVFVGTAHTRTYINTILITGWEYNSNFWLAETDEVSVDTFYIKPGVEIGYESAKSKARLIFFSSHSGIMTGIPLHPMSGTLPKTITWGSPVISLQKPRQLTGCT